jgi:putative cardiolipin synthase
MHNKSFTADNQATIVGGRNVGDEYFAAGAEFEFIDLDVVAIGAAVREVQRSFEDYWTSASAHPAARLLAAASAADVAAFAAGGQAAMRSAAAQGYLASVRETRLVQRMLQGGLEWQWGEARLVVDDPRKGLGRARRRDFLMSSLEHVLGPVRHELVLVSPYFVPLRTGVGALSAMTARGVRVEVLTNALEATDVVAVHAGYAKRRKVLLDAGVRLYEMKRGAAAGPVSGPAARRVFSGSHRRGTDAGTGSIGSSGYSSLHAKTFAVDGERVFVGSFNFDPRSAALNTEMGLVIRSPEFAGRLSAAFRERVPQIAYELRDGPHGGLEWIERTPQGERVHATEPGATRWQRFVVRALQLLPIDGLL